MTNEKLCYTPRQLVDIAKQYHDCREYLRFAVGGSESAGFEAIHGLKKLKKFKQLIPKEMYSHFRVHGMEKLFRGAMTSPPTWYSGKNPNRLLIFK